LTLVSDRRRLGGRTLAGLAAAAAAAGVDFVQLREKDLSAAALLAAASELVAAVRGTPTRILVNARPDIARLAGAHGVQLPEQGLPPAEVKVAFPSLLLGVSCHSLSAARRAAEEGADFVLFGPVFGTPGKEGRASGVRALAEVVEGVPVPVHAIGGIEVANVAEVWRTGCAGVAAIRAFLEEPLDPVVLRLRLGFAAER
jgi:thiamine-phosphate pyrophosphorylase